MKIIKKIGLCVISENEILIVRKFGTEKFLLPGGKPEGKETEIETLLREIREELDCSVQSETLVFRGVFADKAANDPDSIVEMKAYLGDLAGSPKASSEIDEIRWFCVGRDDLNCLSDIVRNKVLPDLVDGGLLRNIGAK